MVNDALDTHARGELGLTETNAAKPLQAAIFSALSFFCRCSVTFSGGMAVPGTAGFYIYYYLHPSFTGRARLSLCDCQQSLSLQGDRQNYLLERAGDAFVDGSGSSRRTGIALTSRLILSKVKSPHCTRLKRVLSFILPEKESTDDTIVRCFLFRLHTLSASRVGLK